MKKFIFTLSVVQGFFATVAHAATPVNIHLNEIGNQLPSGFTSLPNIIGKIFYTTITAALVLFLVMLLFGGLNYLTGAGNEESTKKAKGRIIDATIGLIITLSSWAIGTFILAKIGYSGTPTPRTTPTTVTVPGAILVTAHISQNTDGTPAEGATITINGFPKGTTRSDGSLTFQLDQGPKNYDMVIHKDGCTDIVETANFVAGTFSRTLPCTAPGTSQAATISRLDTGAFIAPPAAIADNPTQLATYQQIVNELQAESNRTLAPQQQTALAKAVASGNAQTISKTIDTIGKTIGATQQKIKKIKQTAGAILTSAGATAAKKPPTNGGSTQQDNSLVAGVDAYNLGAEDGQGCSFENPYTPDTFLYEQYNAGYGATFQKSCTKEVTETPATDTPLPGDGILTDTNTSTDEGAIFDLIPEEEIAADQGKTDGQQANEAYAGSLPLDSSHPLYANPYQSGTSAAVAYDNAFTQGNQPAQSDTEANTTTTSTDSPAGATENSDNNE